MKILHIDLLLTWKRLHRLVFVPALFIVELKTHRNEQTDRQSA